MSEAITKQQEKINAFNQRFAQRSANKDRYAGWAMMASLFMVLVFVAFVLPAMPFSSFFLTGFVSAFCAGLLCFPSIFANHLSFDPLQMLGGDAAFLKQYFNSLQGFLSSSDNKPKNGFRADTKSAVGPAIGMTFLLMSGSGVFFGISVNPPLYFSQAARLAVMSQALSSFWFLTAIGIYLSVLAFAGINIAKAWRQYHTEGLSSDYKRWIAFKGVAFGLLALAVIGAFAASFFAPPFTVCFWASFAGITCIGGLMLGDKIFGESPDISPATKMLESELSPKKFVGVEFSLAKGATSSFCQSDAVTKALSGTTVKDANRVGIALIPADKIGDFLLAHPDAVYHGSGKPQALPKGAGGDISQTAPSSLLKTAERGATYRLKDKHSDSAEYRERNKFVDRTDGQVWEERNETGLLVDCTDWSNPNLYVTSEGSSPDSSNLPKAREVAETTEVKCSYHQLVDASQATKSAEAAGSTAAPFHRHDAGTPAVSAVGGPSGNNGSVLPGSAAASSLEAPGASY